MLQEQVKYVSGSGGRTEGSRDLLRALERDRQTRGWWIMTRNTEGKVVL